MQGFRKTAGSAQLQSRLYPCAELVFKGYLRGRPDLSRFSADVRYFLLLPSGGGPSSPAQGLGRLCASSFPGTQTLSNFGQTSPSSMGPSSGGRGRRSFRPAAPPALWPRTGPCPLWSSLPHLLGVTHLLQGCGHDEHVLRVFTISHSFTCIKAQLDLTSSRKPS